MTQEQTDPFSDDLEWCYDAVQGVSRTFALTVANLDEPIAREICLGYLLCRVADTVEDATHIPPADQQRLLSTYSQALDPDTEVTPAAFRTAVDQWIPDDPDDDWDVVAESPRIVRTFRCLPAQSRETIRPAVRELTDGMAMFVDRFADAGGLRLRTFEELEEYCWYAAGTVGTLVTGLLSHEVGPSIRETLEANARSFALLLQLVNVAKDVTVDYQEENNVYLPQEVLADHGVSVEDIDDPANSEAFAPVIRCVVERAEQYLDGARRWLEAMPTVRGNTFSAWAIPFLLAVGTLRELDRRPEDVLETGDVKVSRREVQSLLAVCAGEPDHSLEDLQQKIRQAPLHEY